MCFMIYSSNTTFAGDKQTIKPSIHMEESISVWNVCRNYQNNLMPNIHGDRRFRDQTL